MVLRVYIGGKTLSKSVMIMMTSEKEQQIIQMVEEGKTIVQVCRTLDLEWQDVRKFLHSVDMRSWTGAKKVITNRLNSLRSENEPAKRQILADDVAKWTNYLYEDGKQLASKVSKARRAIEQAQSELEP